MFRIRLIIAVAIALSLLGLRAQPTFAGTVTDCPTSESALSTDITTAGSGGTVTLSCTSATTIYFDTNNNHTGTGGPITISQSVTLDASGSPGTITLDGGGSAQLFVVTSSGTLTLSYLILQNGYSAHFSGGGAVANSGTLNIIHSTLSGNIASSYGGAITNTDGGSVTVTSSTFSHNSSTTGGAITNGDGSNYNGVATITSSTFANNSATSRGGALSNFSSGFGYTTVTSSTFSGNSAGYGGALYNTGYGGNLDVYSSTLSNNSASNQGGAIFTESTNPPASTIVYNSIIAHSSNGGNCSGPVFDGGFNLEDDAGASCGFSKAYDDIVGQDPKLDANGLQNNGGPTQTIALELGSPAIDGALTADATCGSTDQRGYTRPDVGESSCDIGAYEYQDVCPSSESDLQTAITNAGSGGTVTLNCSSPQTVYFDTANGHTGTGSPITIGQSVTLDASGSRQPITLDGGGVGQAGFYPQAYGVQLFSVNSGVTLNVKDLALQNGQGTRCNETNSAGTGVSISGCGGAIYNSGTLNITGSTLTNNCAACRQYYGHGGAIYNNGGTVNITASTLYGNAAPSGAGGAIYNTSGGTATITTSTIEGNSSAFGGAIENIQVQGTQSSTVTLITSTIADNTIQLGGVIDGVARVAGSIIAGNTVNCSQSQFDFGYNLEDDAGASCGFTASNHDVVGKDPLLSYLTNNGGPTPTMALQLGSPAIDQIPVGTSRNIFFTIYTLCSAGGADQRGDPRPDSGESSCDLGAYESDYPPAPNAPTLRLTSTNASGITNVNPPTFGGTAGSGDTVNVYADGATSAICSATADGSGNWNCTPGSMLSQGRHSITATATASGGTSQPSSALSITIDTTDPGITITPSSEPANPTSSTSASFGWTGSDIYDTITGYTCQFDQRTATSCTSPQSYSGLTNGSHTFTVSGTDQAGNTGSASYTWTVDTAAPSISITNPSSKASYPLEQTGNSFSFSCSDSYDTVTSCSGNLSGAGISGSTPVKSGDAIPTTTAGTFTLTVDAKDQAGNSSQQQVSYTVTNPAPTTSKLSPASGTAGSRSAITLVVDGSNFVAGLSQVQDWNGATLSGATYYNQGTAVTSGLATEIDVTLPSSDLSTTGTFAITVVTPGPGGGTSNPQEFFVTPSGVSVSSADTATSSSSSGTATAEVGGTTPGASGSLTAAGSGAGTVAVAQYTSNPEPSAPPASVNAYIDVYVPTSSSFSSVTITDCALNGGSVLYYWTGSAWQQVATQSYDAATGCVTATITNMSILAGTPLGVSDAAPTLTLPSNPAVMYGAAATISLSAQDPEGDAVTLSATGLPNGLSLGSTTCTASNVCSATITGTDTADVGGYTATITATETDSSEGNPGSSRKLTIQVTPVTLTVTPPSGLSVQYSDPLPSLAPAIAGYVLGQGAGALTTVPTCSTTAATASFSNAAGTVMTTTGVNSPAGTYPITCSGGMATNYVFDESATATLTVTPENAAVQLTGNQSVAALPGSGAATIPLTATVWDSAASDYSGANRESGSTATIGDVTKMEVEFDIYPAGTCLSGSPAYDPVVPVSATGTPGVGTASYSFAQSTEGSFCVVPHVVGATAGSANPYYTAPDGQVMGIAFYANNGQFATGGGWIADPGSSTGQGTFGFNARYNKNGGSKGQMVYVWQGTYQGQAADFSIESNALSSLSFTQNSATSYSATLQGKCSYTIVATATGQQLYSEGNDTFIATATDADNGLSQQNSSADSFSLTTFQSGNTKLHPIGTTAIGGGNVVAHN